MRPTRIWIAALFGCGVTAAVAFAPSGCSDPNRLPPVMPGLAPDPSVGKPTLAPTPRHANIPELTPAAYIVLDAGMITDSPRPVDAAP